MFTDDELYLILNLINQPMKMDIVVAEKLIELDKKIKKMLDRPHEELQRETKIFSRGTENQLSTDGDEVSA